jgi:leucyl/phenylalanyl-tRNA--protein transferase
MHDPDSGEIQWFRPPIRAILPLDTFHISRSLAKTMRDGTFEVRFDTDFESTMRGCADRPEGTWISEEFIDVYSLMHKLGLAHSVEVCRNGQLAGGLYGVALGGAFMAESMFHYETDASKVALASLVQRLRERQFCLLDVQYTTTHLARFGAVEIPHAVYYERLRAALRLDRRFP